MTPDFLPKVTMAQIAEKAGVSKATVSRALGRSSLIGEKVCAQVEMVARDLGYVRKSQKRHAERSILTIKVVLPSAQHQSSQLFYGFLTLVDGLREGLRPSCANIIVETYDDEYCPFPHKKGGQVDAFVFAFHRPSSEVIREIREQGAACVVLNRIVRGVRQVVSDHHEALRQIAGHLADRGVTGNCCFVSYRGINDVVNVRLKGFSDGCIQNGITFDMVRDSLMVGGPDDLTRERVRNLYEKGVRTFVGVNDVVGIILMQQLRRLDLRIPEDVRVTGCDRAPLHAITCPRLTTVDLSVYELAKEVGCSLQSEIMNRQEAENTMVVKGKLLIGETT